MEKKFKKVMSSLEAIFDFVEHFLTEQGINPAVTYSVNLAIEEFFTNMVKYSPENSNDIEISLVRDSTKLTVSLTDTGVEPFDVTQFGEVDTSKPLVERKRGGLGIHLAKQMVDSISYEYADRTSKITFTKNLET